VLTEIMRYLSPVEWALVALLFVALILVGLALIPGDGRVIRSRPMPLPDFKPSAPVPPPVEPESDHRPRHSEEGDTRRLDRGVAPASNSLHPRGRWAWLDEDGQAER
jgi:hypothetical protein